MGADFQVVYAQLRRPRRHHACRCRSGAATVAHGSPHRVVFWSSTPLQRLRVFDPSPATSFGATAGGLLAKPIEELKNPKEGTRWDALPFLKTAYGKDVILSGVESLQEKCKKEHISILEASLRWEKYHSALSEDDGVLLGASSNEQIEENLKAIEKGPLPQSLVAAYEDMWKLIQSEAPPYHH